MSLCQFGHGQTQHHTNSLFATQPIVDCSLKLDTVTMVSNLQSSTKATLFGFGDKGPPAAKDGESQNKPAPAEKPKPRIRQTSAQVKEAERQQEINQEKEKVDALNALQAASEVEDQLRAEDLKRGVAKN